MTNPDPFAEAGFLSQDTHTREAIRGENCDWFQLANDVNAVLMRIIMAAADKHTASGSNWSKEAVALRLLMRSACSFQGAILLAERGMVAQARMIVRSIVEDSFFAAALLEKPDDVVQMLRADAEASRRSQAKFIVEHKLGTSPAALERLESAIAEMDAKARFVQYKEMAKLSSMLPQYLNYQRLSDDAVHTSATSLHKHVAVHSSGSGWSYRLGAAAKDDITATLHRAVLSVLPIGVVVTQLFSDTKNNADLAALSERFSTLPTGAII